MWIRSSAIAALLALLSFSARADGIVSTPVTSGAIIGACGAVSGQYLQDQNGNCGGTTVISATVLGGPISGTTLNVVAPSGIVGEVISAQVLSPGTALATNSLLNLTNVTLTAGDWDCRAVMSEFISPTTTVQQISASISSAPTAFGTQGSQDTAVMTTTPVSAILWGPKGTDIRVGPIQKLIGSTTTFYLVEGATFATSNMRGYGTIECRRMR